MERGRRCAAAQPRPVTQAGQSFPLLCRFSDAGDDAPAVSYRDGSSKRPLATSAGGLVGRGRALEIILSANDFDGETAERYGYVNRALPDAELDGFVDALARRIASFDRRPIAAAKKLVNQVSLPSADHLLDGLNSFLTALTWPEALQRIQTLLKQGLQQDPDFEKRWPEVLGTFLEDQPKRP